ncbi:MAG: hypothetical protein GX594_12880 [Pirellulaceae bacterium]|nr:hypothetical protein [Pirellulaceae bacterium]
MNNSTLSVELCAFFGQDTPSGSASWNIGAIPLTFNPRTQMPLHRKSNIGLALILVKSSLTAIVDPWMQQQKEQRSQTTTPSLAILPTKRRISLSEAREMALKLLYTAERRRLETAEAEAARGINWEDIA